MAKDPAYFDKVDWKIMVNRSKCDTLEDIAALYAQFDSAKSARKAVEIYGGYVATNENLKNIDNAKVISLCASGIAYSKWTDKYTHHSHEEKGMLLVENVAFCQWINSIFEDKTARKFMSRFPITAALFSFWKKSQQAAREFAGELCTGSNPNPKSPSRTLQMYLMMTAVRIGRGVSTGKKTDPERAIFIKCIQAWNGYRSGKAFRLTFVAGMKVPTVL